MKLNRESIPTYTEGLIGAVFIFFVGWAWHVPVAVWLSTLLLVRSFRGIDRWYGTLPVLAATVLFRWLSITGGWEMPFLLEFVFSVLVLVPLWAALYVDRWAARRGLSLGSLVLLPLIMTVGDFLLGFSPVGTVFSPGAGQFSLGVLSQTVSLTGLWGLTFLIGLTATTVNRVWEKDFDLRKATRPVLVLFAVFAVLLTYGTAKVLLTRPDSGTVRIAGVTESHAQDYWAITDAGTPRDGKTAVVDGMNRMNDQLFADSQRAAEAGAEIIFWSEGNAVLYEDDEAAFLERSAVFAREHGIYFAPGMLVLRYERNKNDNLIYLFGPDGEQLFRYEKTISWYPTDSDGIVPAVDTPWGTLSAVICFDLDFPRLLRQAARKRVDILLVPGFDTEPISPYHTQIGLLRGVEYGFSVFRQANKSTSIAADYNGNILAYQHYFDTEDRVMMADVPVKGIRTVYGALGDWIVFLSAAMLILVVVLSVKEIRKRR
jgi:apolipoprotein N-acyltransferase